MFNSASIQKQKSLSSTNLPISHKEQIHHGTTADLVVAKSVAIESPKQIAVSQMLLNLLQDTG